MKYRLAIFDFDGTLADTLPWMRSIFNELAEVHGFRRVEAHEFEQFRDLHGLALLRELGLPLWKLPRVMRDVRRRMGAQGGSLRPFPGAGEMLRGLDAAGVRLGMVSSNTRENVERVLGAESAGLIGCFACGASLFGKPAKLRQVIRHFGVRPAEAIYIGDEVRDGEAAEKAGAAFGAVTWGQHSEGALRGQKPAEVFGRVEEIVERVA